jgi:hypothetical protein
MAKKKVSNSRPARWSRAVDAAQTALGKMQEAQSEMESAFEELNDLKGEYEGWKDGLPENLANSTIGEKLSAICDLDFDGIGEKTLDDIEQLIGEAESMDLPLGFGRD